MYELYSRRRAFAGARQCGAPFSLGPPSAPFRAGPFPVLLCASAARAPARAHAPLNAPRPAPRPSPPTHPPPGLPSGAISDRVIRGVRPVFPVGTPQPYAELAQACWAPCAAARPAFADIVARLKAMAGPAPLA
jgi:hypothetical protein